MTEESEPTAPDLPAATVAAWLHRAAERVRQGDNIVTAVSETAPAEATVHYPEYNADTHYYGIAYDAIMQYAGVLGTFEINEMNHEPYFPDIKAWFRERQDAGELVQLIEDTAASLETGC